MRLAELMPLKKARSRLAIIVAGFAAMVAGGAWYYYASRPLEWHANRILTCYERKDAACIASYAIERELAAQGIDRQAFARILSNEVFSDLVGSDASTRTRIVHSDDSYLSVSELFHWKDGTAMGIPVQIARTDAGIRCPHVVANSLLAGMYVKYLRNEFKDDMHNKIVMKVRWAEQEGPRLEREYGLIGVFRDEQEGLERWAQFANQGLRRLPPEIIESMRKADQLAR